MNTKRISTLKMLCAITLLVLGMPFGLMANDLPDISPKDWPAPKPKVERLDIKASFIVCMIPDGNGGAFVGTEDYGVYHYDCLGNTVQYTCANTNAPANIQRSERAGQSQGAEAPNASPATGMGDNSVYALAIDKLGRLWVGHLNAGVSIFNGREWRNYDVVDGPIGERIFDIQACPVDGDVWIATSAGITRYKIDADEWEHYTREDGLPEDQASSLAFKKDGTLIVGTQCHGLAVFSRNKDGSYKHARNVTAPDRYGPLNCSPVPLVPYGTGLPSNQINQVLVARDGTIWIATTTGLVKSDKNLVKMQYVRGRDYADKVRGLYGGAPKEWKECPKEVMDRLMPEDYITCVNEDANGFIWLGTRRKGFMAIDPKSGDRGSGDIASMGMADNYVSAILPMEDGSPLIGLYIGGVVKPKDKLVKETAEDDVQNLHSVAKYGFPKLPSPMKPPTIDELKAMRDKLEKLTKPLPTSYAAYYGEDWKTQGDWIGRYGWQYAILCGVNAPYDRKMYRHQKEVQVDPFIGPNTPQYDVIRRWVHWLKTDNPKTLYDPYVGDRRQAEWDDHGETYPMTKDGPHLWYLLHLKKSGVYRLSMYFFNKDGHTGHNRMRDYQIEIHPFSKPWNDFEYWPLYSQETERQVRRNTPLSKSRLRDFWGGAYKTFVVTGPAVYAVKIDGNYSFNTILSSVMVDRMIGEKDPRDIVPPPWIYVRYHPPKRPPLRDSIRSDQGKAAYDLWDSLAKQRDKMGSVKMEKRLEWMVLKSSLHTVSQYGEASRAALGEKWFLSHLTWQVKYWDDDLREEFRDKMAESWVRFCEIHPHIVSRMHTPRVNKYKPRPKIDIWTNNKKR